LEAEARIASQCLVADEWLVKHAALRAGPVNDDDWISPIDTRLTLGGRDGRETPD